MKELPKINNFYLQFLRIFFLMLIVANVSLNAQPVLSNSTAENVLLGNYNPADYLPSKSITNKDSLVTNLVNQVSEDSLKSFLIKLESFGTRNTGSDTNSNVRGIGATRRWIRHKFNEFSARNNNRLLVGYLSFTSNACGMNEHRNVIGVLPGTDTSKKGVLIVQGHMDSRCETSCDTGCYAPGMDDNGSGTVLIMELARVMSQYSYDRTIIFTTVTGEEQGLKGGDAMAGYIQNKKIDFMACLNNDVVGGVECGPNSSPPSCSPAGSLDSINLRVFSFSPQNDTNFISKHKQLARYIKLQQIEELNPAVGFNTNIQLQIREDRVGRGGDHIPFRQRTLSAIRFTSANEHGDGAGNTPDRQHTTTDVLGYDLSIPPDGILDTFLISFNYLRRNTLTNGINLMLLAKSPPMPEPDVETYDFNNIKAIEFKGVDTLYNHRIGVRRNSSKDLYFDTVLTFTKDYIHVSEIVPKGDVQLHFMNVDNEGIESIITTHLSESYLSVQRDEEELSCISLFPNPVGDYLNIKWKCSLSFHSLKLLLVDVNGQTVKEWRANEHNSKESFSLDVSGLPSGQYQLISIVNEDEVYTESIIIQ